MLLHSLSDKSLLSTIHELTRRERRLTLVVLLHLNEIERRKLHLELAYKSMFEFCTTALGYSESAASRRLRAARCVARFPEVYALLESNEVNVSTVAQVARVLSVDNQAEILTRIRGKSQRQVEAIVAEYEPRAAAPRDRVRTVVVRVPVAAVNPRGDNPPLSAVASAPAASNQDRPVEKPAIQHNRNGCECKDPQSPAASARLERLASIQFCANETFMAKLEKVKSLVWHRLPANASLEQVFELALDSLIEREDPSRRQERREQRAGRRENTAQEATGVAQEQRESPRRIPRAVRDSVFLRDNGRCAFKARDGRRCDSTRALQIDHVRPVARGGPGTTDNLRLLCAYHNRLEAERLMGSCGRRDGPTTRTPRGR